MIVVHVVFVALVLVAIVRVCTAAFERSFSIGRVVSAAVILRAALGFALLAASHSSAALQSGASTGDGFWALAPDAKLYYSLAVRVAVHGPLSLGTGAPSPFFVIVLGGWLQAAGSSLASVVLFNVSCYSATAALILAVLPRSMNQEWVERAGCLVLLSFGFSPVLLLSGSQALKDPMFVLLIVLVSVAAIRSLQLLGNPSRRVVGPLLTSVAILGFGMYGITGIRPYYGLFLWVAYGAGLLAATCLSGRSSFIRTGISGLVALWFLWLMFTAGGGLYYQDLLARTIGIRIPTITWLARSYQPSSVDLGALADSVESLREGFIQSGGNTNLDEIHHWQSESSVVRTVTALCIGTSAMFVPISVLRVLSVVTFHGGRGLLAVTDIDTIFLDLTLCAGWFIAYRHRATHRDAESVIFLAVLAIVSGALMAVRRHEFWNALSAPPVVHGTSVVDSPGIVCVPRTAPPGTELRPRNWFPGESGGRGGSPRGSRIDDAGHRPRECRVLERTLRHTTRDRLRH